MNNNLIVIQKKFTLESDLQEYLTSEENTGKFFRVYRVFTTKVNNESGCQKFSLEKNTITFYSKNKIMTDFIMGADEFTLSSVNGMVKYYLIERM